jgi:hypothetical protein
MTKTHRTNEAFAALAYRRSIIQNVVVHLSRTYLGADGQDPKERIISEEIAEFIDELKDAEHALRLEMGKFELIRRSDVKAGTQWKKEPKKAKQ